MIELSGRPLAVTDYENGRDIAARYDSLLKFDNNHKACIRRKSQLKHMPWT